MSDLTVANKILRQLGGRRFSTMTGAKSFVGSHNSLAFRIPGNITRQRINAVRITLDPEDTYSVVFMAIRGTTLKEVSTHDSVYAEDLAALFRDVTGLETRMPVVHFN